MPRRVLLLITDLKIGGTPTVVRELAVRLHRPPDAHVEVACLSGPGPVAVEIERAGLGVTPLNAGRLTDLPATLHRLRSLVKDHRIDTVFSFLVHANVVAAAASRKLPGVRFFQSIQTTQPRPRWHWWLQREASKRAERIVVPSESVAHVSRAWAGVPPEKLVVIGNAVDPGAFRRSPVPDADPRPYPVAFIGRLDPIKRVPMLIEAAYQLPGLVHLDVWGEGPDRRNVEAAIARAGDGGRTHVTLHGATPSPADALARAGLLVLPSAAEGFGLVLIEAMAAGVPVVATDVPGIRDVVRDGENGLLVGANSPAELAGAIQRVVQDRVLRSRLISGGERAMRERFSWDSAVESYRRVLEMRE